MNDRLQKIIARAGLASRRAAEELILAGRVRVNGRVVRELGAKADPRADRIEVDGQRLVAEDLYYLVLHKPRGVVSTMSDPEGRPTVAELVKHVPARLYPVGRLDFATSGVLLMTNDGAFANGLLHPRRAVPKTYVLKVSGRMDEDDASVWRRGVMLEDGITLPAEARILRHEDDKTWLEVTLREGRNQQIRRMGDATGFRVMRLARVSFAGVTNEGLRPGELRPLTREELMVLREEYGVPKRVKAAASAALDEPRGRPVRRAAASAPARREPERGAPAGRGRRRGDASEAREASVEERPRRASTREAREPASDERGGRAPVRSERSARSAATPRGAARPASRAPARGRR
jgi:23S rRNA pseudouridine2605 synthase